MPGTNKALDTRQISNRLSSAKQAGYETDTLAVMCFARLLLVLAAAPVGVAQQHSPPVVKIFASFDAVAGNPTISYKDHPDVAIAACSKCGKSGQIVVVTGQDVAVYDPAGKVLKVQSTRDFIAASGVAPGKVNDPRATYDPFIQRWIVVCSCSADFLMVSERSDATGRWKGVALSDSTGDLTMFPGWDKNGVYVSEYYPQIASQELALPASDVAWKGEAGISLAHLARFKDRPYETRPAVDPNPNKQRGDAAYFIARSGPPQNVTNFPMDLIVERITWSGTTASVGTPSHIPTGFFYSKPGSPHQPSGPDVRGVESHRVFSVSAHGGRLYVVEASGPCARGCGEQGEDANNLFFWFEVDPARMTILRKAKVSHPLLGYVFPTLAVDGRGNSGMVATGSSRDQHASIYLFARLADDAAGVVRGPVLAHAGTHSYSCTGTPPQLKRDNVVGWGTYSGTVRDASDPMKLWTVQEYGGSATPCIWTTRVMGFRITERR
jgi:hypothetical protein